MGSKRISAGPTTASTNYKDPFIQALKFCLALNLAFIFLTITGCAVERSRIYVKDGKEYGVTSSYIWRGQWWNYYERGSSYAEGQFWPDATEDFQAAIKQRAEDQRKARTYGLHFIDYFPHRELGIVYFHLGNFQEAIRELEISLKTADTSKAKFYLNKARKAQLQASKQDISPPRIVMEDSRDDLLTNKFSLQIKGRVEAEAHVSAISINGGSIFIELAEPQVSFVQEITLREGRNPVEIVAVDLLGRAAKQQLVFYMDRQGPLVSVERVELIGQPDGKFVLVEGYLADRNPLRRFSIGGRRIQLLEKRELEFREEIPLLAGMTSIIFEAEDVVGNITRGDIQLPLRQQGFEIYRPVKPFIWTYDNPYRPMIRLVSSANQAYQSLISKVSTQAGKVSVPAIKITGLTKEQTVYSDTIYLEGKISSGHAIVAFTVNGESLWHRKSQQLFISYLAQLQVGENRFILEVEDEAGRMAREEIVIIRKLEEVKRLDSRLRLILFPLNAKDNLSPLGGTVYDHLFNAFVNQGRFDLVERQQLETILKELKLSQTELVDPDTAAKIGKIVAAEGIIIGTITEIPQALEVFARFVDVETSVVLAAEDIYGENITPVNVKPLMEGLAWKFQKRFPLVEGLVIKKEGKSLFIDLGNKQLIKKYMKLIVFRESEAIKHPVTGKILGSPTETLGEARVEAVFEELSQASFLPRAQAVEIRSLDKVITK